VYSLGRSEEILGRALKDFANRDEEVITHLAFYAGWPSANTAVTIARRVFEEIAPPQTENT
jgi:alkylhydroperoxidase/carboxymuconolactone decarboxylase family protein YurZ